ncbi:MAG: hypothetical protein IIU65_04995, partial [Clostridia bacterium]|nr:hypothetical protein [Clostridia bacterium]
AFNTTQYKENSVATALTTSRSLVAGDKLDFTSKTSVAAGKYKVILQYRAYTGRAKLDITMGDSAYKAFTSATSGGTGTKFNLFDEYIHSADGPVNITFDAVSSGSMYIEALILVKFGEIDSVVTIDGVNLEVKDGKATMPMSADFYIGENCVYVAGEEIEVQKDLALTSYETALKMKHGAAIRLNKTNGIRFYTDVNSEVIETLKGLGTIQLGTLISPADLLDDKELTFNNGVAQVNVTYEANLDSKWNLDGFVGSLVEIKESNSYNSQTGNIGRDFVGRGYVTLTVGDMTKTIYADYDEGDVVNNTRSVAYVANAYKNDVSSGYDKLAETVKAIVDRWAKIFTDLVD